MPLTINGKPQKIALVKQETHQDLYQCHPKDHPFDKILSTRSRSGPGGLFTLFGADFYIVKEEQDKECQFWTQKAISKPVKRYRDVCIPAHAPFARRVKDINWGKYDIVISLDISIPFRIVRKHPKTLWLYMPSEVYMALYQQPVHKPYDAVLNQNIGQKVATAFGKVQFPYNFIGPDCLQRLVEKKGSNLTKAQGVYICPETRFDKVRDRLTKKFGVVREICSANSGAKDHKIRNLERIYNSKYFVRINGRQIRGNGIIEAISVGTLVISRIGNILHPQLIHPQARCSSWDKAIVLMEKLEKNPKMYNMMLNWEREKVRSLVKDNPTQSLKNLRRLK
jgi:hypothetical protein